MNRRIPLRFFVLLALLLSCGWGLLCRFAPWRQVAPWDSTLGRTLGRAPLWSHLYDSLPGARVDATELLVEAAMVLILAVLLLSFRRLAASVTS